MRKLFVLSAKNLTVVAALAVATSAAYGEFESDVSSCHVEVPRESAYDWFKGLQDSIAENSGIASEANRPEVLLPTVPEIPDAPSPLPAAVEDDELSDIDHALTRVEASDLESEPDEKPLSAFDLREPMLSKLRSEAREAANAPRTRRIKTSRGWRTIHYPKNQPHKSKFLCYQGVKEALLESGLTKNRLPHVPAKWAHQKGALKAEGFENLLETEKGRGFTAANAPLGAVLVYDGGQKKCERNRISCGHIEIKLNAAEYCSDYCKSIPINQYLNRKLIGVYVKTQK